MIERGMVCRRCQVEARGDARPFVLPGARPTFAPDRVVDVRHLRIEVAIDFAERRVEGTCRQTLAALNDGPTRVRLDAVEMEIREVRAGGAPAPFRYDGKTLEVELGARKEGEVIELEVRYGCAPRRGLYFIRPDEAYPERPVQVWSQGQDEDNRCWFPCFDHPHEKATSEVVATVPARMFALSNGALVSETLDNAKGEKTYHYRHDVVHSSYLVTLVAGEYTAVRAAFEDVEVLYWVPPGREEDVPRSFENTPRMMKLFSELTGRKYPYPRYSQITVAEFIFGGMENTSATTLTDQTLHDARAHLDFSSEPLVAHELAHQWFGDLLTCRDWSEGWLNEGFATYFEILWKEHAEGRDEADFARLADLEAYLDEDGHRYRRPIVTNVFHEPIDVFDRHLYEKGGCVLHMLRSELGDARFWKAIRHYVKKHAGGSVETRDLARAVEEATGWNSDRFFRQWVFQAGHPQLETEYSWDEEAKAARLSVKQTQTVAGETPLFVVPVTVRFVVGGETRDVRITIKEAQETFVIPFGEEPTQAIVDPGEDLLKTLEEKKPEAVRCAELASAEPAIARIRAARALGKAGDATATEALGKALAGDPFWAVRGEAGLALAALKTSAARDAIAAALPKEQHPKARRMLVRALGAFRGDEQAADAIAKVLGGDASYFVEAESAYALAKTRSPRAFDALTEAMKRPSYLDAIRSNALAGIAELRDARGVDVALSAARYGEPPIARRAAIGAMAVLGAEHEGHKRRVRETLCELLDDPDFRARIAAVEGLRVLGDAGARDALLRAAGRDLDGRVRRRAREVERALVEGATQDEAVRGLRDRVETLERENRELKERMIKLESRESKT
jgi:aminopeptidase N